MLVSDAIKADRPEDAPFPAGLVVDAPAEEAAPAAEDAVAETAEADTANEEGATDEA